MAKNSFNICYTSEIFSDVAEMLRYGLIESGIETIINPSIILDHTLNLIIGAHLIQDHSLIPKDSIIFNLEQLGSRSVQVNERYLELLFNHTTWDYSERNIDWLSKHNIESELIRFGYSPALNRIHKDKTNEDIDILFYGAINERRLRVINLLIETGLNVVVISSGVVSKELDSFISRSKVILNMHYYETQIFEIVRVSLLLCNQKAVVSEVNFHTEIENDLNDSVLGVPYENLVPACIRLVQDHESRRFYEERGWHIFSNRLQSAFIRRALDKLIKKNHILI